MFIVSNYLVAVIFCFITMLCWGSWGNTQKLAAKNWRYELFYWDYVLGMVLFALLIAFTMGSFGSEGRPFLSDIVQVSAKNIGSIILGGVIFNASNILLSASTSIAGLAVAFPLGVGISLVLAHTLTRGQLSCESLKLARDPCKLRVAFTEPKCGLKKIKLLLALLDYMANALP